MMMKSALGLLMMFVVVNSVVAGGPSADGLELTRTTVASGGMNVSNGNGLQLEATVGQPEGTQLSGDGLTLTGGFWFGVAAGDCQYDGDVDLFDYADMQSCMTGPEIGADSACSCFDVDGTGTVDLGDFAQAQRTYTGS